MCVIIFIIIIIFLLFYRNSNQEQFTPSSIPDPYIKKPSSFINTKSENLQYSHLPTYYPATQQNLDPIDSSQQIVGLFNSSLQTLAPIETSTEIVNPYDASQKTIEHSLSINESSLCNDNILKLDTNTCSKSCCKFTQWKLPDELEQNINKNNYIVPTNFSCNFGNGSGCVCMTKKNFNYLSNRG